MVDVLKKFKVSFSAFELLRVPIVRDTFFRSLNGIELLRVPAVRNAFFRSLNGNAPSKLSQEALTKKVSFNTLNSEPMIREILGKKLDQPLN